MSSKNRREGSFDNLLAVVSERVAGQRPPEEAREKLNPVNGFISMVALASAGALTGCAAGNEAVKLDALQKQMAGLEEDLAVCRDKGLETNGEDVIVSYGTFGLKTLKPGKPNYFFVNKNFEGLVEQSMLIWPPVIQDSEIKLEGDQNHLFKVPMGSFWGVVFKSPADKPKETVVIEVGKERYVIFVVRR